MRILEGMKPRIVIRKTNKYMIIQYVVSQQSQDFVKKTVNSKELLDYGWPKDKSGSLKSIPASYLSGLLFGNKIKEFSEKKMVDTGLITNTKGSRVFGVVKGIVDSGIDLKYSPEVIPKEEKIKTEKVKGFFDKVKEKINAGGKK